MGRIFWYDLQNDTHAVYISIKTQCTKTLLHFGIMFETITHTFPKQLPEKGSLLMGVAGQAGG